MNRPRLIMLLLAATMLAGCNRTFVDGHVTDAHGAALPGVIVRVGEEDQDLTDAVGHYRVSTGPASKRVEFSKSGYTSSVLLLAAKTGRSMPAVSLWPLPMNAGVYVVNNLNFAQTAFVLPKQHYLKDGSAVFGAELPKDIVEAIGEPFIVAYRTPRYNARLSRLVQAETPEAGVESGAITVWVESGAMAAALEPVDTPPDGQQPQLLRVQVGRPLEPGVYGVHWGALEGYTTLDARVFLFKIPEPPESEKPAADTAKKEEAIEPKPEAKDAKETTKAGEKATPKADKKPAAKADEKPAGKFAAPQKDKAATKPAEPPQKNPAPKAAPAALEPADAPADRPRAKP